MRQIVLLVIAVCALAAAGFIYKSKMKSGSREMVVRNTGSSVLTVAVGNQAAKALASGETASDEFVEGVMVRVWIGDKAEGFASGWRVYQVIGEVSVSYDGEAVIIAGDGLDFTKLNNGPGANATDATK